jgi:hypothetical protein
VIKVAHFRGRIRWGFSRICHARKSTNKKEVAVISQNDALAELLAEGLDLCRRAREMDAMDRRNATLKLSADPQGWLSSGLFDRYVEEHNSHNMDSPIASRSGTLHLWVLQQYEVDLADWERRAKAALQNGNHLVGL